MQVQFAPRRTPLLLGGQAECSREGRDCEPCRRLTVLLLFPRLNGPEDLDLLGTRLQARSVPLIPPFWPMHLQPAYKATWDGPRKRAALANAEYASGHVLLFPCYPDLSEDDIAYMAAVIKQEEQWAASQQS